MMRPAAKWRLAAGLAVSALALAGCGGSSGGGGDAKQGACIDAGSPGTAHVVGCGSAAAKATLVDNGEVPSKAIACVMIDPGTQHNFSVTVAGKVYCAQPKGSGTTPPNGSASTTTTTASGTATISPAFVAGLKRIEGPYKKWGADIFTALRNAGKETDAQLARTTEVLFRRGTALSLQLEQLLPAPDPVSAPYRQLVVGTNKAVSALAHLLGAATTHTAALARRAVNDLNQALIQAASGINGLKAAGIK